MPNYSLLSHVMLLYLLWCNKRTVQYQCQHSAAKQSASLGGGGLGGEAGKDLTVANNTYLFHNHLPQYTKWKRMVDAVPPSPNHHHYQPLIKTSPDCKHRSIDIKLMVSSWMKKMITLPTWGIPWSALEPFWMNTSLGRVSQLATTCKKNPLQNLLG